jgi:hypothetical protein
MESSRGERSEVVAPGVPSNSFLGSIGDTIIIVKRGKR